MALRPDWSAVQSPAVRRMLLARWLEAWDPELHLRDKRGRFSSSIGGRVADALASGFSNVLDGFNREQLRREAKRRDLNPPRGASIDAIKDMLWDHRSDSGGSKSSTTRSPVANISGREWADARAAAGDKPPGGYTSLVEWRANMGHLTRQEQDDLLRQLAAGDTPGVSVIPAANLKGLTGADRDASVRVGGEGLHAIRFEAPTERVELSADERQRLDEAKAREREIEAILQADRERLAGKAQPRPKPEPAKVMTPEATLAAAPKQVDGTGPRKIGQAGTAALERYRGKEFSEINGHLRGTAEGKKPAWVDGVAGRIDAVHAESRLTEDVVVHRGIGDVTKVFGPAASRKLTGAEWQDDAFQSTTADADTAERFLVGDEGRRAAAIIKMRVPAGTGAVQLSDGRYEAEVLLQRGLRMRVVSDTGPWRRGQKKPRTIEVEVVPA